MAERVINFFPGPCTLPLPTLEQAQREFLDYCDTGMSLWETSHRTTRYEEKIHNEAIRLMHEVFQIPEETHRVLLLGGGGTLQFAMIPMNLLGEGQFAEYIYTGHWAEKAINDAKLIGDARVIASGEDKGFLEIPKDYKVSPDARYFYYVANNTIYGTEHHSLPESGNVPLIADMSSNILSRPVDWSRIGLTFAGLTKNLGPAGMAVVIIRKDLLAENNRNLPKYLRYDIHDEHNSMYNTPPTFCTYMMKLFLEWTRDQGGVVQMDKNADLRANMLYETLDRLDDFYTCRIAKEDRSRMNICWELATEELENEFVAEAEKKGLYGLAGHFLFGHCRASLYNAMSLEGVERLCNFMEAFRKSHVG